MPLVGRDWTQYGVASLFFVQLSILEHYFLLISIHSTLGLEIETDELTYSTIGIPKGKIFIINPKGEVALYNEMDVKSYTSLHTMVHDMFPPTSLAEQEHYNFWNYWRVPLQSIE